MACVVHGFAQKPSYSALIALITPVLKCTGKLGRLGLEPRIRRGIPVGLSAPCLCLDGPGRVRVQVDGYPVLPERRVVLYGGLLSGCERIVPPAQHIVVGPIRPSADVLVGLSTQAVAHSTRLRARRFPRGDTWLPLPTSVSGRSSSDSRKHCSRNRRRSCPGSCRRQRSLPRFPGRPSGNGSPAESGSLRRTNPTGTVSSSNSSCSAGRCSARSGPSRVAWVDWGFGPQSVLWDTNQRLYPWSSTCRGWDTGRRSCPPARWSAPGDLNLRRHRRPVQNAIPVTITFLFWKFEASLAIVIFLCAVFGMIAGAIIVSLLRAKAPARKVTNDTQV